MRRRLVPLALALASLGCGGSDVVRVEARHAPPSNATASASAQTEAPPPIAVRVALTHRFFVATGSMDLPLLDVKAAKTGLSPKATAAVASVEREVGALLATRKEVAAAWGRFEQCTGLGALSDKPRTCDAEDRKLSQLNERYFKSAARVDARIEEATSAIGDDAASVLARAWLEDQDGWVRHSTDRTAPGELEMDTLDVTFELGESARTEASGGAYRAAARVIAANAPFGVLVRERAAIEAMAKGDLDEATLWLAEARGAATGSEVTEVLFLLGEAHARRFPDGVAEAERALEGALSSPASTRVKRADVARALVLAAYRASDFPRALAVALDLRAGRFREAPPPEPVPDAKGGKRGADKRARKDERALADSLARADRELLASLADSDAHSLSIDGTTTQLVRIEADAIERIGLDHVDLSKADDAEERRLRGELAVRALYVGDVGRARSIVAGARPSAPGTRSFELEEALGALCARNAAPEGAACPPPRVTLRGPRRPDEGPPISIEDEELEGARAGEATIERRVFALARLCVEPAFLGLGHGAPGDAQEIALEISPGPDAKVTATAKGDGRALDLVASCMASLGPARFADLTTPVSAHVDVTSAARRYVARDLLRHGPPPIVLPPAPTK